MTPWVPGIELEPTNEALWRALRSAEDAQQVPTTELNCALFLFTILPSSPY